jgi:hypothetical protein
VRLTFFQNIFVCLVRSSRLQGVKKWSDGATWFGYKIFFGRKFPKTFEKSLQSVNKKYPYGIGPGGRWLIFAGIPLSVIAILFTTTERSLDRIVGHAAEPYVLFFVPAAIAITGMVFYDYFPKRLIIPIGIIGWIMGLSIMYWYSWFGPGAFGHH